MSSNKPQFKKKIDSKIAMQLTALSGLAIYLQSVRTYIITKYFRLGICYFYIYLGEVVLKLTVTYERHFSAKLARQQNKSTILTNI